MKPAAPDTTPAATGAVLAFFLLTFAVTWACYIPVARGAPSYRTPLGYAVVLFGTYAPSMVATALTALRGGGPAVRALWSRLRPPSISAGWYVFALTYTLAIKLIVIVVHRLATGAWPRMGSDPWFLIPFAIAISTPFQAGEEVGWRGYALPRLAARLGFGGASVVLGVIWAVWHLPLFFVAGADTYGQSFPVYLLQVMALSVAMTWLVLHSTGSLLPVMLMHAAVNNTQDIAPGATPGASHVFGLGASLVAWLGTALLWAGAAWFLIRMSREAPPRGADSPAAPASTRPATSNP